MRANNMGEAGDVVFDDLEGLLREINEFCSSNINKPEDIPQSLERYLKYVAKTGNTVFPWQHVRPLFRNKILHAMDQFPGEMCPNNEAFVLERFDMFRSAPFTIQRLSELIIEPNCHYKKKEKFLRGLEKTVLVVSTVEPWSIDNDSRNGNESTSASDGEMDQTYSESDDSAAANRTFTMDRDQHDIIVTSASLQNQGEVEMGHGLSLSNPCVEGTIENVTTTMVNITSNGSQSTTTIMSSTTTSNLVEGVNTTSELGLSAVVASIGGPSGDDQNHHASDTLMQLEVERATESTTSVVDSRDSFTTSTTSAVLDGLEMTTVELGHVTDTVNSDEQNMLGSGTLTTLNVERVEIVASVTEDSIEVERENIQQTSVAEIEPQEMPLVAVSVEENSSVVVDAGHENVLDVQCQGDTPDVTEKSSVEYLEKSDALPDKTTTTVTISSEDEAISTIPSISETLATTATNVAEEIPLEKMDDQPKHIAGVDVTPSDPSQITLDNVDMKEPSDEAISSEDTKIDAVTAETDSSISS